MCQPLVSLTHSAHFVSGPLRIVYEEFRALAVQQGQCRGQQKRRVSCRIIQRDGEVLPYFVDAVQHRIPVGEQRFAGVLQGSPAG